MGAQRKTWSKEEKLSAISMAKTESFANASKRYNVSVTTLYYYSDKKNEQNLFTEGNPEEMFPNNRMGKNNENLIKQITYISKDGDTLSLINYKY